MKENDITKYEDNYGKIEKILKDKYNEIEYLAVEKAKNDEKSVNVNGILSFAKFKPKALERARIDV